MSEAWDKQTFGEGFREGFDRALETVLADPLFSPLVPLLTLEAKEKIARFIVRLVDANRQVNLTAITGPVESATKHVADSLTALLVGTWREGAIVCDLGTGGGLPGVVLSIVRPDLHVRLVDSAAKKLAFLAGAVEELGLNCETVHSRGRSGSARDFSRSARRGRRPGGRAHACPGGVLPPLGESGRLVYCDERPRWTRRAKRSTSSPSNPGR